MLPIVGESLTGLTVRRKLRLALAIPSLTLTVILAVPLAFGAGVSTTVRLPSLPPRAMLALGTKVALSLVAVTTRDAAKVSVSATVKAMPPVGVSSSVVWAEMLEIVGAVLAEPVKKTASAPAVNPLLFCATKR